VTRTAVIDTRSDNVHKGHRARRAAMSTTAAMTNIAPRTQSMASFLLISIHVGRQLDTICPHLNVDL
jgi:hypothetical protein